MAHVVVVLAMTSTAHAQRVGIVAVTPSAAPVTGDQVRQALGTQVTLTGGRAVAPFDAARLRLREGAVRGVRLEDFARARTLAAEGWAAYIDTDHAFAVARLSEARRVAERVLDLDGGARLYADICIRLANPYYFLNQRARVMVLLALAHRLAPERPVTASEFRPEIVSLYEQMKQAPTHTHPVRITTSEVGAQLTINGRSIADRAPTTVRLAVGQHVVVARVPGAARVRVIDVAARREPAELDVNIEFARATPAQVVLRGASTLTVGTGEVPSRRAIEGLVVWAELDAVVLAVSVWRRGVPVLLAQWCEGVPVQCGAVIERGFGTAAGLSVAARHTWTALRAQRAQRQLPPILLIDARVTDPESDPSRTGTRRRGSTGMWWWVGAGAGVAILAVSAAVVLGRDRGLEGVFTGRDADWARP